MNKLIEKLEDALGEEVLTDEIKEQAREQMNLEFRNLANEIIAEFIGMFVIFWVINKKRKAF